MILKSRKLKTIDENGMVAIVVTMVIMIIVTLIVSSFGVIVRREQRQSIDRQLSSQAFYAAESGVGDAISWINRQITVEGKTTQQLAINDCDSFPYNEYGTDGTIEGNVKYSCILIDGDPQIVQYDSVAAGSAIMIPVNTDDVLTGGLRVSWENIDQNVSDTFAPATNPVHSLPQQTGLPTGMVEATLVEGFDGVTGKTSQQFTDSAHTMYLYPNTSASASTGSTTYSQGPVQSRQSQGDFVDGNCFPGNRSDTTYACNVNIGGLTGKNYFLRLKPLYQDTKFRLTGFKGSQPEGLKDVQVVIDATGKSADVLRRIQVRIPVTGGQGVSTTDALFPLAAIESVNDICKRLQVIGSTVTDSCLPAAPIPPPAPGGGEGNAAIIICENVTDPNCDPNTKDPNAPQFRWIQSFTNASNNNPSTILNCTWDWGDGTAPTTFPARSCDYGDKVKHEYPHTDAQILNTNGAQGCRRYTVKLTMYFTPSSNLKPKPTTYQINMPGGLANDVPGGICSGKWDSYTP